MEAEVRRKEHSRMKSSPASVDQVDFAEDGSSINSDLMSLPSTISVISGELGGRGTYDEQTSQHGELGSVVDYLEGKGSN